MAEGNGNGNGWLAVISKYGVPSAIALFLVWFMAFRNERDMRDHQQELRAHTSAAAASAASLRSMADESRAETRALISLLRQVCVNTARTDEQRRECVR